MKELAKKEENQVTSIQGALLEVVKNPNIDPERLEKFLDLQIKMEERQALRDLNAALAEFQSKCPVIPRTKASHNAKYAPLDEIVTIIKPILSETGLSYSFDVEPIDERTNRLATIIKHKHGAFFTSYYYFPRTDDSGKKNEAQSVKSANSYARRAGLENALGIVTADEDTDANPPQRDVTPKDIEEIKKLIKETKSDEAKVLLYLKAESIDSLNPSQVQKALHALKQKRSQ